MILTDVMWRHWLTEHRLTPVALLTPSTLWTSHHLAMAQCKSWLLFSFSVNHCNSLSYPTGWECVFVFVNDSTFLVHCGYRHKIIESVFSVTIITEDNYFVLDGARICSWKERSSSYWKKPISVKSTDKSLHPYKIFWLSLCHHQPSKQLLSSCSDTLWVTTAWRQHLRVADKSSTDSTIILTHYLWPSPWLLRIQSVQLRHVDLRGPLCPGHNFGSSD